MDEKISLEAIALYGDAYADRVLRKFFAGKDQITGKEILSLCNVNQVNLFVIRELFKSWREETRKQKSVYFDNEHPEVKEALATYMNALSNHILIDQEHFKPLLKKAVSQTLLVIFDPYDFYSMLITGKNNKLEVAPFREEIKYLKINKAPLERMLQKLEEKGMRELPGNEAFAVLDQILEEVNFTPEDLDGYIAQFSDVLPLDPSKFFIQKEAVKAEPYKQEPVKTVAENKPRQNQPIRSTLNDQHVLSQQPAVIDTLRKISRIKEHLSINQKFMFTKVLFYGDFDSFSRAIDELDQQPDLQSALSYLEHHSSAWDRDSKEFHEFMELVEKRFA
jgi:hypothetical protein